MTGEVLVGLAPNTQQLLYESDSPDKPPNYIFGTLYVTNHKLTFIPSATAVDKVNKLFFYILLLMKCTLVDKFRQSFS